MRLWTAEASWPVADREGGNRCVFRPRPRLEALAGSWSCKKKMLCRTGPTPAGQRASVSVGGQCAGSATRDGRRFKAKARLLACSTVSLLGGKDRRIQRPKPPAVLASRAGEQETVGRRATATAGRPGFVYLACLAVPFPPSPPVPAPPGDGDALGRASARYRTRTKGLPTQYPEDEPRGSPETLNSPVTAYDRCPALPVVGRSPAGSEAGRYRLPRIVAAPRHANC
jgi:hypothetical protein